MEPVVTSALLTGGFGTLGSLLDQEAKRKDAEKKARLAAIEGGFGGRSRAVGQASADQQQALGTLLSGLGQTLR